MDIDFRRKVGKVLLALFTVLAFTLGAYAQREAGLIAGTVTDPSGAVVSGAKVTIKSVNTGAVRTAATTGQGAYTVTNLLPGPYDVTVEAAGFAPQTHRVDVTVGSTNTADFKMSLTQEKTTVEVVGAGGVEVETNTQQLSSVVSGTQITTLPTLTRNPYDLVATAPNVQTSTGNDTASGATARGVGVTINGQRSASTDILLDGGENVDEFTAALGQQVPLDSVQEFRVITSDFSAEYGRASGGVVNVATKQGTNDFHGTAYEFNRLAAYTSNTYNNAATGVTKPGYTRNQFGWSIGGPIVKNKLFFFQSTEFIRVRSNAAVQAIIPTPQFIAASAGPTQTFFSQFGKLAPGASLGQTFTLADLVAHGDLDPTAFGPNLTAFGLTTPAVQKVNFVVPSDSGGGLPQNTYMIVGRVDYNMTDKTTMYGRYALYSENDFEGSISSSPWAGYNTGQTNYDQNAALTVTHVFTPNLVSQSKAVFNRLNNNQPLSTTGVVPALYMNSVTGSLLENTFVMFPGYLPTTPASGIPFGGPQNLAQFYEDLSWTHGNHQFKFGGQYVYTRDNRVFGAYEEAVEALNFVHGDTTSLENFLGGNLGSFQTAIFPEGLFPCKRDPFTAALVVTPSCTLTGPLTQPNFSRSNRYNDLAAYAQDSWRIHPRLTLNLGVRWEYYGVQHNQHTNLDSNFYFGGTGCPPAAIAPFCPGYGLPDMVANGNAALVKNSSIGGLWNPDYNNVAPRVGFAWDVFGDGKTSLRGGFGISYERNFGNVTFNVIQNPPNYAGVQVVGQPDSGPISTSNLGPLSGTGSIPFLPASLRFVDNNIKTAYAEQWDLALQREVAKDTVLSVEYSGSRGIHLYDIVAWNNGNMGCLYLGYSDCSSRVRNNLQYTGINGRSSHGDSYYHALVVSLRTNNLMNWGLSLNANYTYSHSIDDLSTTFSESSNNFDLGYMDGFNPGQDRGNGDADARHRIVVSGIWDLPIARNSTGITRQVLGGWTLAPIFQAHTGFPFTVWDCAYAAFTCIHTMFTGAPITQMTGDPTNTGPNSYTFATEPGSVDYATVSPLATAVNPAGNGIGAFGDFGLCPTIPTTVFPCPWPSFMPQRNSFRGPGWWDFNLGVYKNFKLTERFTLQFRSEFYNIFNHHNFFINGGSAEIDSQSPAGALTQLTGVKGGFGTPTDERRFIQFALKLIF